MTKHLPLLIVHSEIKIWVPDPDHSELPALWWDAICDKCLLLGVFKHGKKRCIFYFFLKGIARKKENNNENDKFSENKTVLFYFISIFGQKPRT